MKILKKNKNKLIRDKYGILTIKKIPSIIELKEYYQNIYWKKKYVKYSKEEVNSFELDYKLIHYFQNKRKKLKILYIGCGEGFAARYFIKQGYEYYGTDFSSDGITNHQKKFLKKINFLQCDIVNDDFFSDKKFDLIICKNVAEHVINYRKLLKNINKKLNKNGILAVIVPNEFNKIHMEYMRKNKIKNLENMPFYFPPDHIRYFNPQSLKKSIEKNTNIKIQSLMTTFPIELFMLNKNTDYYKNKKFGKSAHNLRINFNNLISKSFDENSIKLFEGFCKIGIGRQILAIGKKY